LVVVCASCVLGMAMGMVVGRSPEYPFNARQTIAMVVMGDGNRKQQEEACHQHYIIDHFLFNPHLRFYEKIFLQRYNGFV